MANGWGKGRPLAIFSVSLFNILIGSSAAAQESVEAEKALSASSAMTDSATTDTVAAVPEDRAVEASASIAPVSAADDLGPAPSTREVTVEKLTPLVIEILDPLGSKLSTSLDTFSIRVSSPLIVDGAEVIPAGIMGEGEVVHAKKAGGMGTPGELVLAARFLDMDGMMIRLRSMKLGVEEPESRVNTVNTVSTVAAATVPLASFVGFFIKGGNIDVPEGSLATAKIARTFTIEVPNDEAGQDMAEGVTIGEDAGADESLEGEMPEQSGTPDDEVITAANESAAQAEGSE